MMKIVKEHIGFHYLLIEVQLYTLILLELNIFLKKYSKINQLLTIYLEYKILNLLCVDFVVLLSQNDKIRYKYCKDKYGRKSKS